MSQVRSVTHVSGPGQLIGGDPSRTLTSAFIKRLCWLTSLYAPIVGKRLSPVLAHCLNPLFSQISAPAQ
jgi:hypothetical protein